MAACVLSARCTHKLVLFDTYVNGAHPLLPARDTVIFNVALQSLQGLSNNFPHAFVCTTVSQSAQGAEKFSPSSGRLPKVLISPKNSQGVSPQTFRIPKV